MSTQLVSSPHPAQIIHSALSYVLWGTNGHWIYLCSLLANVFLLRVPTVGPCLPLGTPVRDRVLHQHTPPVSLLFKLEQL